MVYVIKLDGTKQPYNEGKIRSSLLRSGACDEEIEKILKSTRKILYNGITTKKLFRFVFKEFKKFHPLTAAKYDMKNAILRFGSTGFPFEKLVARLFRKKGYSVRVNQIVRGKYIPHEIDVVASNGKETIMLECKHHSKPWLGCDIQTALYVYARFLDLSRVFNSVVLVTNTKFSAQVIRYSRGVGLNLLGWRYPQGNSLELELERNKIFPITMMSSLKKSMIMICLKEGILTIHDLLKFDSKTLARFFRTSPATADIILKEAKALIFERENAKTKNHR